MNTQYYCYVNFLDIKFIMFIKVICLLLIKFAHNVTQDLSSLDLIRVYDNWEI